jgi:dihydrofolate synthase/folylpolyglutamate synthase
LRRRSNSTVDIATGHRRYEGLRPALRGAHQAENLALAIAAAEALRPGLAQIPQPAIQQAVAAVRWPGRCETLQERPLVLLDGAINAATARAFLAVALPISRAPIVAIAGVPADKDYAGLFRTIGPRVQRLYITRAANPHLRFPPNAASVAARYTRTVVENPNLAAAVERAMKEIGPEGSLWIVGTQSLLADALRLWGRDAVP